MFKKGGGAAVVQLVSYCAASRNVAGSIPSGRSMALGSTQPLK